VHVSAIVTDAIGGTASAAETGAAQLEAVADAPVISAAPAAGYEDTPVPLHLAVASGDRDGSELSKFGTEGKVKASDFGGCCEPKCLRVLPGGDVLTAESGPPTCIKRFSSTGEFIEVVAVVPDAKGECVRVTVAASSDGSRYYMLDTTIDAIRVFSAKQ
jgi:hypothetical protein